MNNKKLKPIVKAAVASTIAITSTAAIVYAGSKTAEKTSAKNESKFVLNVQNVDNDTVKVSLDNIEDIPRSLQFSLKLDGVVLKEKDGQPVIKDLINKDQKDTVITDYSYNRDTNTVDVLVTSTDTLPKKGNQVEVFELDIEKSKSNSSRNYTILPLENTEFKYVSNNNKEYSGSVTASNEKLSINSAPVITKKSNDYIEIKVSEKLSLTKDELSKYLNITDDDNDEITLEVKNSEDKSVKEFSASAAGIYDLYVTASDSFGGKSETVNIQVKVSDIEKNPVITKDGQELQDVTIKAGEIFNLLEGVKAVDAYGNSVKVTVKVDKELDLDPEEDTEYILTYTATDNLGRTTEKSIKLKVIADKKVILAESITINSKDTSLYVGSSIVLTASVDEKADMKDVEWEVSDNSIVSFEVVGNDIKITAKKTGKVTVTAKTKDGSNKTDSITINVTEYKDNIKDFISDIIDKDVITHVDGTGTADSPAVLEVKNISPEKFDDFINKLEKLQPELQERRKDGEFTVYIIKVKNNSALSKFKSLFKSLDNKEGYIKIKVSDKLDNSSELIKKLDSVLKVNVKPDEDTNKPGNDSSSDGGNTQKPEDSNKPENTEKPEDTTDKTENAGNASDSSSDKNEADNINKPVQGNNNNSDDKSHSSESKKENTIKDKLSKLPLTGKMNLFGAMGFAFVGIGTLIYKKKKEINQLMFRLLKEI